MALDGQPLEQIEKLLAVAAVTSSQSVHGVVQDAVVRIVSALRCLFHSITFTLLLLTSLFIVCAIYVPLSSGSIFVVPSHSLSPLTLW